MNVIFYLVLSFVSLCEVIFAASDSQRASGGSTKNIAETFKGLAPVLVVMFIFYFFLIVPQNKRKKKQEELIASVKKGEEVLTNSGIFGKVAGFDEKSGSVFLEVAKGLEMKVLKNHIVNIVSRNADVGLTSSTKKDKASSKVS